MSEFYYLRNRLIFCKGLHLFLLIVNVLLIFMGIIIYAAHKQNLLFASILIFWSILQLFINHHVSKLRRKLRSVIVDLCDIYIEKSNNIRDINDKMNIQFVLRELKESSNLWV